VTAARFRMARRIGLLSLLLLSSGCGQLDKNDQQAIDAWLTCIECRDGEWAALEGIAAAKHDALLAALFKALHTGPSAIAFDNISAQARAAYREVATYRSDHGLAAIASPTEADFAAHYAENFNALYRKRAAYASAVFGRKAAADTLAAAVQDSFRIDSNRPARADINRAIKVYIDSIVH